MTAVRLPMIATSLRPAGDGDSDDGILRRERRRDIDSAVGGALSLLARRYLAHTSRGLPVRRFRRVARLSLGMIVVAPVAAFNSP